MTLSPAFLDELRARTHLSSLIARSLKLTKAGREFKACCPFHHEKTPSFYVNDEKGFYHCFGCQAHGDAIRWLTDAKGLAFMDAVKELADAAGMEVPAPDPRAQAKAERAAGLYEVMEAAQAWFVEQLNGIEGAAARDYLKQRGIDPATRERFGFGFAPDNRGKLKGALARFGNDKLVECGLLIQPDAEEGRSEREPYDRFRGRLTFPIRDPRGRVIAFSARILGPGEPKYLNSPDTPLFDKGRTLFNYDQAAPASRTARRVIVVEGQMDAIALAQAGIGEAVAPLGTALTEAQLGLLWRLSDAPILCFDGDAAGTKAAVRAAERALPILPPGKTLLVAQMPINQDPDDVVSSSGKEGFEALLASAMSLSEFLWKTELRAESLETPEARAAFGRRLRDHAKRVSDEDIRLQYLAFFNAKLDELFAPQTQDRRESKRHKFVRSRGIPPEMLAIAQQGIVQAVYCRVILQGLRNYPEMISRCSEAIALLWIENRQWRQIREAMLIAGLETYPLGSDVLETKLKEEGLAPSLQTLQKPREMRLSFLKRTGDAEPAKSDLFDLLDRITAGASFDAAIKQVLQRIGSEDPDRRREAYQELERLNGLSIAADADLRSYSWRNEEVA